MQVCLMPSKGNEKMVKDLRSGGDVSLQKFSKTTGIDTGDWPTKCPCAPCTGALKITAYETTVVGLWCPKCGWIANDGFAVVRRFMSVPDLARAQNSLSANTIRNLILQDVIPAADFGRSDKSRYMVPIHIAEAIITEGITWDLDYL